MDISRTFRDFPSQVTGQFPVSLVTGSRQDYKTTLSYVMSLSFFMLVCIVAPALAAPSFNCKNATSPAEIAICQSEGLGKIDSFLDELYKQALLVCDDPNSLRNSQLQWLKNRPAQREGKEGEPFEWWELEDSYESRIRQLLRDQKIHASFFNHNFLKKARKDPYTLLFGIIALWEERTQELDLYNGPILNMVRQLEYIDISDNKMIAFFPSADGAYTVVYEPFILTQSDQGVSIEPYVLPLPTEWGYQLTLEDFSLNGNFGFDNQNKTIGYGTRPSSVCGGNECTWKLIDGEFGIVSTVHRCACSISRPRSPKPIWQTGATWDPETLTLQCYYPLGEEQMSLDPDESLIFTDREKAKNCKFHEEDFSLHCETK